MPSVLLILLLLATGSLCYAPDQQDDNRHPDRWITARTPRLIVHYPQILREEARIAAQHAETVLEQQEKLFGFPSDRPLHLVIRDSDFGNGLAIASLNQVEVWIADMGFDLRGTHPWLNNVLAHELGHITSIRSGAKIAPWLPELQLGWSDASDAARSSGGWLVWSLAPPYGMDFAEGTAQWTSELAGSDYWDTHRAMIERVGLLDSGFLPAARMGVFSGSDLDLERVYNQGYSLVRHVAREHGKAAIPLWWREMSRFPVQTTAGAFERLTGKTGQELQTLWREEARSRAKADLESALPLVEGRAIDTVSLSASHPAWRNNHQILFVSDRGDDVSSLWLADLFAGPSDSLTVIRPVGSIRSSFALDTARSRIIHGSARGKDRWGRHTVDLWTASFTQTDSTLDAVPPDERRRLTTLLHAQRPVLDHGGDSLLVVVRDRRVYRLEMLPFEGDTIGEGRTIFDGLQNQTTPAVVQRAIPSPDGEVLAIDWVDDGIRRVDLIDRNGVLLWRMGGEDSLHEWREPCFSPDGQWILASSDRTGIFNLYRQNLIDRRLEQLTSVVGGAFQPSVSPDGRKVAFRAWSRHGYGLRLLDSLSPFPPRPARQRPLRPKPLEEQVIDLVSTESPYVPMPSQTLLVPVLLGQRAAPLLRPGTPSWSALAGVRMHLLDPLRRNAVLVLALGELGRGANFVDGAHPTLLDPSKDKVLLVMAENRSLRPTFTASWSFQTVRGLDTITAVDPASGLPASLQQEWSLEGQSAEAGARWSFAENHKIHGYMAWSRSTIDLFNERFRYRALQIVSPIVFWTHLVESFASAFTPSDPRGRMLRAQWSLDKAEIARSGSFREVFRQDPSGRLVPRVHRYAVHRLRGDASFAGKVPGRPHDTWRVFGSVTSIPSWSSSSVDTLDDILREGLVVPGYSLYRDAERLAFQGEHTALFEIGIRSRVARLDRLAWTWFLEEVHVGAALHAGRAWDGPFVDPDRPSSIHEGFARSGSLDARLTGRLHSVWPLGLDLRLSTAFDEGPRRRPLLRALGLPLPGHRLEFGVNLGLNPWGVIDQPIRPRDRRLSTFTAPATARP